MCCLSAMVMLGADWCQCATLLRKHTLQPVVWRCHLVCPNLLILTILTQILKYVACAFMGGSPSVHLVILGTNWCWCADTDKEAHLSFY